MYDVSRPDAKQNRRATTPDDTPRPPVASCVASRPSIIDPDAAERQRHFELIGYGPGAVELVAGTNNLARPDVIDLIVWTKTTFGQGKHTRKWIESECLIALDRKAARLAEQWGNIYISVGTYGQAPNPHKGEKLQYSRRVPLPRRCFPVDDVTDLATLPLPPTWVTETSYCNHQLGYTCDELLTPAEAVALAAGAARLLGADPSGADATQLIRLAGTLNTKPKCAGRPGDPTTGQEPEGWRVRLVCADGPRYSRQQLAETFLPGGLAELDKLRRGAKQPAKAPRSARPGAELTAWDRLPDGEKLMGSARHRALWANRPQLAKLARGERVTLMTERGPDDTDSAQVAVLVANYLTTGHRAAPGGPVVEGNGAPPLDEIRAVALSLHETLRPGCDLAAYQADVERLIARYRPPGYAPEPTRGLSDSSRPTLNALPSPRQRGRPAGQRAEQAERLAQHLAAMPVDADGVRRTCRAELALALRTTERMISGYLADLRAAGRLETRTEARALAVLRVEIKCPPDPARKGGNRPPVDGIGTRETASGAIGSTHPAPRVPPAPAPAPPGGGVCAPTGEQEPDEHLIVEQGAREPAVEPADRGDEFDVQTWLRRCKDAPLPQLRSQQADEYPAEEPIWAVEREPQPAEVATAPALSPEKPLPAHTAPAVAQMAPEPVLSFWLPDGYDRAGLVARLEALKQQRQPPAATERGCTDAEARPYSLAPDVVSEAARARSSGSSPRRGVEHRGRGQRRQPVSALPRAPT